MKIVCTCSDVIIDKDDMTDIFLKKLFVESDEQEDALEFAFKLESSMEMEIRRSSEINQNPVVCSKVLDTLGQV